MVLNIFEWDSFFLWFQNFSDQTSCLLRHLWFFRKFELKFLDTRWVIFRIIRSVREGKLTKEHFEQEYSEAPDVNSLIIGSSCDDLVGIVTWCSSLPCSCRHILGIWTSSSAEPKVTKANVEFLINYKNILWFDISVHNLLLVDHDESIYELWEDFPGLFLA